MTAEIEKLLARLEKRGQQDGEMANHYVRRMEVDRIEAATALRAMQAEKRELALDVLAASGQAQEAYEAQLAAEAKLAEVEKDRERLRTGLNTAWADRDMHSKARAAAEATVATLTAQVEAMRGALRYYNDTFCEGFCKGDCWSDEGHSHPDLQRDCSGCLAASVLIRAALTTEKNDG